MAEGMNRTVRAAFGRIRSWRANGQLPRALGPAWVTPSASPCDLAICLVYQVVYVPEVHLAFASHMPGEAATFRLSGESRPTRRRTATVNLQDGYFQLAAHRAPPTG